ncbi:MULTISPECIES: VOC family protein [Streptomyces]|uniref:VOC family protein n=1 Tax=Streptomyces caniscabiei TaxID=2746961 RepID=A0ABU4MUQ5_9ACTN|nr:MULTISPECIES: VOC family protein [Streptomyces]MBE4737462.1 VOC family protein [Streptomyces caniscabiei]MBE4756222.1 VOC family protein [Streptomyces caniscabiei]MBE4769761.1 VOC family protein [Streptomyces caniscabiei]MBE4787293.1 VOC family protein [Streptomyces caniscabiei]MBE4795302.1 VOC family protein [Streptomyces caniscabiei]
MAAHPEGAPCWVDAMFNDVEGAKSFYGEVLGWTFGESSSDYGNYTQAYADGKAVAAVVPPMPGQEGQSAWCLYFATSDVNATATKVRDNGGDVLMEPMQVGDFGSMLLARSPDGVVFGGWQAGAHQGFEAMGVPGAYIWAEIFTREPEKSDAFFPAVFSYRSKQMDDPDSPHMDFRVFDLGQSPLIGRMKMTAEDFPPEVPSYINVYFTVPDCDDAVAKATKLGGVLRFGPMDTPFGRFAALSDPQGASFSVIDVTKTQGEMPELKDVD